jgi:uncharacterized membrane protein YoaK (UPF0700 family)
MSSLHQSDRMMATLQSSVASQERLAAGLAMIAGYVDAYGYITCKTYLSFMSGNTTQTGSQLGQGHLAAALPSLLAIMFLVIGVFTGTLLPHSGTHQAWRLRFGVVAALLAVIIGVTQLGALASGVGIATLSLAMGMMNTALSHVGAQSVSLTFVTGTLNNIGTHLALAVKRAPLADAQGAWDTHIHRPFLLAGVWASFLTGALLSGAATPRFGVWVLLFPLLILLALALFSRADRALSAGLRQAGDQLCSPTDRVKEGAV